MARGFGLTSEGQEQIYELLKSLPKTTQNKVIPPALKKAAKPIAKAANNNVPKDVSIKFGDVKYKSADIKIKTFSRGKGKRGKYALIGAEVNSSVFFNFPTFLEYGTLAYRTKRLVKPRGGAAQAAADAGLGVKKHPFMRPALLSQKSNALKILRMEILNGIEKQADKILAKGKV